MKQRPLISIGIPFRNNGDTLPHAVRSVFAQTLPDWELILLDDGSTDDSLPIVQTIRDPRVRVLSDGQHLTLAPRLNQISREARGKYIARLDADDLMHTKRLEMQVHYLESHPEVDVIGADAYTVDSQLNVVGKRNTRTFSPSVTNVLLNRGLFVHPTVIGRAEWFCKNQYEEGAWCTRCEDYELWIRTSLYGSTQFGYLPEPLLYYREIASFNILKYRQTMKSARAIVNKYGKKCIGNLAACGLQGRFLLQEYIYCLAVTLGLENRLLLARSDALDAREMKKAIEGLQLVEACRVPGLDEKIGILNLDPA